MHQTWQFNAFDFHQFNDLIDAIQFANEILFAFELKVIVNAAKYCSTNECEFVHLNAFTIVIDANKWNVNHYNWSSVEFVNSNFICIECVCVRVHIVDEMSTPQINIKYNELWTNKTIRIV